MSALLEIWRQLLCASSFHCVAYNITPHAKHDHEPNEKCIIIKSTGSAAQEARWLGERKWGGMGIGKHCPSTSDNLLIGCFPNATTTVPLSVFEHVTSIHGRSVSDKTSGRYLSCIYQYELKKVNHSRQVFLCLFQTSCAFGDGYITARGSAKGSSYVAQPDGVGLASIKVSVH